ncbi:VanZ family protein [Streptomyces xiaopingdaonensis]|uniref:VanZ family protein n=1 Tax=Streptomyces xiaopingdaonensis TaxID=1565415 RepID=UPI0002F1CDED
MGGWLLPHLGESGDQSAVHLPEFGLTVSGATSVSVDLHPYAYADNGRMRLPAAGKRRTRRSAHREPEHRGWAHARQAEARRRTGQARPAGALRLLAVATAFAAMVAFAAVLSRLTLQPSDAAEPLTHNNLHPGDSIRDYLGQPRTRDAFRQLGGNLLLAVPFGLLLPVLAPRVRGAVRVSLLTAAMMLLVELVQGTLLTGRAFDVDDAILNSAGALLGYLLVGRRLGRAVHPPKGSKPGHERTRSRSTPA